MRYYQYHLMPIGYLSILDSSLEWEDSKDYATMISTPYHRHTLEYQLWWQGIQTIPLGLDDKDEKGGKDEEEDDDEERDDEGEKEGQDYIVPMDMGVP